MDAVYCHKLYLNKVDQTKPSEQKACVKSLTFFPLKITKVTSKQSILFSELMTTLLVATFTKCLPKSQIVEGTSLTLPHLILAIPYKRAKIPHLRSREVGLLGMTQNFSGSEANTL